MDCAVRKPILKSFQSPGDMVLLTAAVRHLDHACPARFLTDVRTSAQSIGEGNPHLVCLEDRGKEVEAIDRHDPRIDHSNQRPDHFLHGCLQYLEERRCPMDPLIDRLDRMPSPGVLVLGDPILDRYVRGTTERISPEAPVPVLETDAEEQRLGGAASVAGLVAALGAQPTLVGVVGEDADGAVLGDLLEEAGIARESLVLDGTRRTTCKERFLGRVPGRDAYPILRVDRESTHPIRRSLEDLVIDRLVVALEGCAVLLISDYGKGTCTPRVLREAITAARDIDVEVIVDPAREADVKRYRGATYLIPNRYEAQCATRKRLRTPDDALKAASALCRRCDLKGAIVKLDCQGMVVYEASGASVHLPARAAVVQDVTGAGDMVLAALGMARAADLPLDLAVRLANVAAGIQVTRPGMAPVTAAEIRGRFADGRCRSERLVSPHRMAALPLLQGGNKRFHSS